MTTNKIKVNKIPNHFVKYIVRLRSIMYTIGAEKVLVHVTCECPSTSALRNQFTDARQYTSARRDTTHYRARQCVSNIKTFGCPS